MQKSIDDSNCPKRNLVKPVATKIKFAPVTESEICKLVNKMPAKTSTGYDNINNWLLKKIVSVIKKPLCVIFNKSLRQGIYPNLMKIAKVIPLFKSGDRKIPDNYRPISLLPVISKVLEKIVYVRMLRHMDDNNIVYPRQYSFRHGFSTSDAVTNLVGEILNCFNDGTMCLSVFVDLRKAFDTVMHTKILDKLKTLGVEGIEAKWFESFLSERRQFVQIDRYKSSFKNVRTGILQGALLSVMLFLLHINDLPKSLKFCSTILYADDTTLFLFGRSLRFLRCKMQEDLNNLSTWLRSNSLKLNVKKTKSVLFERNGLFPTVELNVDGEEIENVRDFKFLGIKLDSMLSFVNHYGTVLQKLTRATFVLRLLSKILPMFCLRYLYFAYFHSHLTYGMLIWYPMLSQSHKNALYLLQKRLIRTMCNANFRDHCMPLFREQKILCMAEQIQLENCKLLYHIEQGLVPIAVINLYPKSKMKTRSGRVQIPSHASTKFLM